MQPPSCLAGGNGLTNCGVEAESCCTSLEVEGGTYDRTYNNTGNGPIDQADPATVSSFRLDKYAVTVGRFRQFVAAWQQGYVPPGGSGKHTYLNEGAGLANVESDGDSTYETGWLTSDDSNIAPTDANLSSDAPFCTWTASAGTQETLPVNCVNWWEAEAFCIWDDGFLPSESEYEYAAAAGSEEREYPWGTAAPGSNNEYAIYGCYYPDNTGCASTSSVAPVGTATLGLGLWGQLDLEGNMSQWTVDWYSSRYGNPCIDCADLSESDSRAYRGACFLDFPADGLLVTYRSAAPPTLRSYEVGFRCARSP
jgi:formylglycine-generating enzyme